MPPYEHIKQKKSILSFVITLSLMVLLNRVLPLLFKCAVSKIYRTNLWNSNSNLTQPDKWRDQILGSNLSFFYFLSCGLISFYAKMVSHKTFWQYLPLVVSCNPLIHVLIFAQNKMSFVVSLKCKSSCCSRKQLPKISPPHPPTVMV